MTRVIAGDAGGRRLQVPPGDRVRPTSDRVKEAMFSSLGDLRGLVVLDLFAGSGGLAIEALSRGAASAVLVEADRRVARVIGENLAVAGVADRATVLTCRAQAFVDRPDGGPFDLVLLDPPYAMPIEEVSRAMTSLIAEDMVSPGATIVLERDRRGAADALGLLSHDRDRSYGETVLRYFTHHPAPAPEPTSEVVT